MMNAFCASEKLLAFIRFRSSPSQESVAENSSLKRSSLRGADQAFGVPRAGASLGLGQVLGPYRAFLRTWVVQCFSASS